MPSLLLHVDDPVWVPDDPTTLIDTLRSIELLGDPCEQDRQSCFLTGDRFQSLVVFLGCSPYLVTDPEQAENGQEVCRVLLQCHSDVQFVSARHNRAVRCPRCRAQAKIPAALKFNDRYCCSHCGDVFPVRDLDWRKGAGFARFFIDVTGIYPHEAVPSDSLLKHLENYSGRQWRYFYY